MPNSFPMNAWYAAGWDAEIKQALLPRTICGKHVVMYRKGDGEVVALEDACWHRLVPLSKGRLDGDTVVCGYHGLKYNAQGRCTFMPSQETINPSACVRAYPVVERHRFIWLWMGDPALADPATRGKLAQAGQEIFPRERQNPEALRTLQKAEIEKWWPLIKASGFKVE